MNAGLPTLFVELENLKTTAARLATAVAARHAAHAQAVRVQSTASVLTPHPPTVEECPDPCCQALAAYRTAGGTVAHA